MAGLRVTCCIPCRNHADTLKRAVDSAYGAGCNQVMILDDGSTDNTRDVIKKIYDEHQSNLFSIVMFDSWGIRYGASVARNYMINCPLAYELIICLDADDTLNDITPLRDAWQPGTWCYGNHVEKHPDSDDVLVKGIPAGSLARRNITGVTFLFHKDDWLKVGGFDCDFAYAEDYAFQCNLTHNGVKPVYVDTIVYNRYMHPDGNERSALAGEYWSFYRDMARRKYPNVFMGMG